MPYADATKGEETELLNWVVYLLSTSLRRISEVPEENQ